jgi:tetratricopeptide (TPR) repeat protein
MADPPSLYLLPFEPKGGSFREGAALALAISHVVADAVCGRGFPVTSVAWAPPVDSIIKHVRKCGDELGMPDGVAVLGIYALEPALSLDLVAVSMPARRIIAERTFSEPDTQVLFDAITSWLRPLGRGHGRGDGAVPPSFADLRLAAKMRALAWTAQWADSIATEAFLRELEAVAFEASERVADPAMARVAREWMVLIVPVMMQNRRPVTSSGTAAELLVGELAELVGPAGLEHLMRVIEAGLAAGDDRPAFLACRAAVLHEVGNDERALAGLDELRALAPLDGLHWTAQCARALGRFDQALLALDQALAIAPDAPYRDVLRGWHAAPDDGAAPWRAELLLLKGAVLLDAKRPEEAVAALLEAKTVGAPKPRVLEYLAHAYRNAGIQELNAGRRPEAIAHYRKHVEMLDAIYLIAPRVEEVRAALDVLPTIADEALFDVWYARVDELALAAGVGD